MMIDNMYFDPLLPGPRQHVACMRVFIGSFQYLIQFLTICMLPDSKKVQKSVFANGTWCSQAVNHPSTDHARCCLTAVIGREPVFSTWYGR
jgi:hypothetical protein